MIELIQNQKIPIQKIQLPEIDNNFSIFMKREDLIHSEISGNKFWKLKYNLLKAKEEKCTKIITFGGASSNHIAATAYAGFLYGFKTLGIIRGEELINSWTNNSTLKKAAELGMKLFFATREDYRLKEQSLWFKTHFKQLKNFYLLPEGGTNQLAVKGTKEILDKNTHFFDIICCAVGTGGTLAGISLAAEKHQEIIGFPVLKNADFLHKEIQYFSDKQNFTLNLHHHFGGYAKITNELLDFMNDFYILNQIKLDPVYTAKMLFGVRTMIKEGAISSDKKILTLHTGGLQGIEEMKKIAKKKFNKNIYL